jgi:hypothetical protein
MQALGYVAFDVTQTRAPMAGKELVGNLRAETSIFKPRFDASLLS